MDKTHRKTTSIFFWIAKWKKWQAKELRKAKKFATNFQKKTVKEKPLRNTAWLMWQRRKIARFCLEKHKIQMAKARLKNHIQTKIVRKEV